MTRAAVTLGIVVAVWPSAFAAAQTRDSHWGVSAAVVPRWSVPQPLADIWNIDTDVRGSELRVGIVRGSDRGGDVGVSFVRKTVDDESVVNLRPPACIELPDGRIACARGAYHVTRGAGLTGVEAHLFIPLTTIGRRTQIGVELAGGIARIEGATDRFLEHLAIDGSAVTAVTESLGPGTFKASLQDLPQDWPVIPIGRVGLGVGIVLAPGVKLRATGGVNFPGYHLVALHVHYLFGAR